jgi:hypothetical protein
MPKVYSDTIETDTKKEETVVSLTPTTQEIDNMRSLEGSSTSAEVTQEINDRGINPETLKKEKKNISDDVRNVLALNNLINSINNLTPILEPQDKKLKQNLKYSIEILKGLLATEISPFLKNDRTFTAQHLSRFLIIRNQCKFLVQEIEKSCFTSSSKEEKDARASFKDNLENLYDSVIDKLKSSGSLNQKAGNAYEMIHTLLEKIEGMIAYPSGGPGDTDSKHKWRKVFPAYKVVLNDEQWIRNIMTLGDNLSGRTYGLRIINTSKNQLGTILTSLRQRETLSKSYDSSSSSSAEPTPPVSYSALNTIDSSSSSNSDVPCQSFPILVDSYIANSDRSDSSAPSEQPKASVSVSSSSSSSSSAEPTPVSSSPSVSYPDLNSISSSSVEPEKRLGSEENNSSSSSSSLLVQEEETKVLKDSDFPTVPSSNLLANSFFSLPSVPRTPVQEREKQAEQGPSPSH